MEIRDSSRRPHERLDVWQDAMNLVEATYRVSHRFPDSERFGPTMQVRRSAVSVPFNIAEGAAPRSRAEYLRFLSISRGSLSELETQLQIAIRIGYMESDTALFELLDHTFARLNALIRSVDARSARASDPHFSQSRISNPESHA
jgi:four helix bundle protein